MEVFGSELIELVPKQQANTRTTDKDCIKLSSGVRQYIFWRLKKEFAQNEDFKSESNIEIKFQKHPVMKFEIFGELANRRLVKERMKEKIETLKNEMKQSSSSIYNKRFKLTSRDMLGPVLNKITELRRKHEAVIFNIEHDGVDGNKAIPVVQIICDDKEQGDQAKQAIFAVCLKEGKEKENLHNQICCMCKKDVYLPKTSAQKRKEQAEEKKARQEKGTTSDASKTRIKKENEDNLPRGWRLTICGCTYCKSCLETWIKEQLRLQEGMLSSFVLSSRILYRRLRLNVIFSGPLKTGPQISPYSFF